MYAEVVRARIEDKRLRLQRAYARVVLMVISRLKANGKRWYRWRSSVQNIRTSKSKHFPERYRNRKLIKTNANAEYVINSKLLNEFERVKRHLAANQ